MTLLKQRRNEFGTFLWDHAADPFQASFDDRRELSAREIAFLTSVHQAILIADEATAVAELRRAIVRNLGSFALVLQIVGLTRNKILSDLRASTQAIAEGINIPSSYAGIPASNAWTLAGPYLLKRLRSVLGGVDPMHPTLDQCYQALNQSTWSGYIRQERAKRSGHEAEYRLATLLASLRIPFSPPEKAENPLCRDAQIAGISFDIVIPDERQPSVLFKATVHTANIGQYGESKDHLEIDEARRWLDAIPEARRPLLMAFIDGVGFRSNSAGLNGVLTKSDEFCQFRTIWKAVVIAGARTGTRFRIYLPRAVIAEFAAFIQKYGFERYCLPREDLAQVVGLIEAGDALIEPPA